MEKRYKKSLFIFRRDLRLDDNSALNAALKDSEQVLPCFIFDPVQYSNNPYFAQFSFNFMLDCLKDLQSQLRELNAKLFIFDGKHGDVIENLLMQESLDAVYINKDYTPYARNRDVDINRICKKLGKGAHIFADCLLNEPEASCKSDGTPYTVFTPYYKKNSLNPVKPPRPLEYRNFYCEDIKLNREQRLHEFSELFSHFKTLKGGRASALDITASLAKFECYQDMRDIPHLKATTNLSPHLKFGTLSTREAFHFISKELGLGHPLLRQLYWRDFFTQIAFFFPHVFGHAFQKKYENIKWDDNQQSLDAWKNGLTGFPIVDAGMRELNTTGFMHNRVRMITASFLVKDLHQDWRLGERYFASKLVDYDPAVNNGNWQWAASTGCDAQPYFRIFNPWLQQKRFDAECLYIKHWIPELKSYSSSRIHALHTGQESLSDYPSPIVEHSSAAEFAKDLFEESSQRAATK